VKKNLILPVILAILAAFFASQHPDGLDKVSQLLGFSNKGVERTAMMAGYNLPFLGSGVLSAVLAGVAGVLIIYVGFLFAAFIFHRSRLGGGGQKWRKNEVE
jgi:hypothetical protein